MRNAHNTFIGKPEGKRSLARPRPRQEDIRMDLEETGWEGVDWIYATHDRDQWLDLVSTAMNLRVPEKSGNLPTSWPNDY
jgi:hypothetical protein